MNAPVTADRHAARRVASARSMTRKLALQALYRLQLNEAPWQDLMTEFADADGMERADSEYFRALIEGVWRARTELDALMQPWLDREPAQLDPTEHAVLFIAIFELRERPDVPFRVIIHEAVNLARKFGGTDGHKFVNAVLDRAARELRPGER